MAKKVIGQDPVGELLSELISNFSIKRVVTWLERKFASFDISKEGSLSVTENKNDARFFKSARILGFIRDLPDSSGSSVNCPVLVAAVEMKNDITERTSRQTQFNFAKRTLQEIIKSGSAGLNGYPSQGIFFFYDKDQFFRISLVSGSVEGRRFKFNEAKRQSFFINPDRPNNVAKSRLQESIKTFNDLKKAFSVETLTKEFYSRLFEWYEWAMKPKTGVTFPNDLDDNKDDRKYNNESVIRLITRLMFTWFIRQRGLVPDEFFSIDGVKALLKKFDPKSMEEDNYYRCILQNLFFATLNCQNDKRGFRTTSGNGMCKKDWGIKTLYRYEKEFTDGSKFKKMMRQVPFLNCALFDCLDKQEREEDGGRTLLFDGFSDTKKRQAHVPNGLFFHPEKGIITLFDTYEFTIDENNVDDADVALDPELLGKVFENLLGAFNPETSETARKSTGSFYTPREIVDYMVEESLKNYLKTKVPSLKDEWLQDLFDKTKAIEKDELPFDDNITALIRDALYSCKILDPACGSGAFPMGILHCMVRLFGRLDPNNCDLNDRLIARYKSETNKVDPFETATEKAERLEALKLQLTEGQHYPDYARKLYLIENCIYGVDIQPIATQISKLRFFISLLCDQLRSNWNEDVENQGLLSLPNLEAKFVCANTLISLPETEGELKLSAEGILRLREKLQENRHRIFSARTYQRKNKLKERDQEIRDEIRNTVRSTLAKPDKKLISIQEELIRQLKFDRKRYEDAKIVKKLRPQQGSLFDAPMQGELCYEMVDENKEKRDAIDEQIRFAEKKINAEYAKASAANGIRVDELASKVAGWDPYDQNASSGFFDPMWMFNIKDGFDIVIGNPPYVQLQANGGELAKAYEKCGYETFVKTGDIYCLFYERGYSLLKYHGGLCYITSNKWMRAGYGEKIRKFFVEKTNLRLIIDFAEEKIFESATVDTNILVFSKEVSEIRNFAKCLACVGTAECRQNLSVFVDKKAASCVFYLYEPWVIFSTIEQEIRQKIVSAGSPLMDYQVNIYRGILTGCNDAFIIDASDRAKILSWCKDLTEYKKTDELIKPILRGKDVKRYAYKWSELYLLGVHNGYGSIHCINIKDYPAIKKYLDLYWSKISKRYDKGDTPYNLRNCAYWEEFSKPKIVYRQIGVQMDAAFIKEDYFLNDKCFLLTGKDEKFLLFLLGYLNTKIFNRYFLSGANFGGGKGIDFMGQVIVPKMPYGNDKISFLVDRILAAKKADPAADTSALEAEIDQLVYKLYGLTDEEIAVVEGRGGEDGAGAAPGGTEAAHSGARDGAGGETGAGNRRTGCAWRDQPGGTRRRSITEASNDVDEELE